MPNDDHAKRLVELVINQYGNEVSQKGLDLDLEQLNKMLAGITQLPNGVLALTMQLTGAPAEIVASTGADKEVAILMTMARVIAVERQCMALKGQVANLENELVDFRSAGQFDFKSLQVES